MSEFSLHGLNGDPASVALNTQDTIAITEFKRFSTNQTRVGYFTPEMLLEWAEAVNEAYGDTPCIEIAFTPGKPMTATVKSDEENHNSRLGIALAPRVFPSEEDNE